MRIIIMGSGGMGGFLGIKMAAAGYNVTFIARGEHYKAIKKHGIKLLSPSDKNNIHINPAKVADNPKDAGKADLIIFAVKLYDTADAAKEILPLLKNDTVILSIQNGITSKAEIEAITGKDSCVPAAIFISAHVESPAVIRYNGGFNKISFARKSPSFLQKIFDDIQLDYELTGHTEKMLWSKFALLAANSSIGTLLKSGAVAIAKDKDQAPIFKAAIIEVMELAAALHIDLCGSLAEGIMSDLKMRPSSEEIYASQLTALNEGKKLELFWVQGEIHRLGLKHNVPTPLHSLAYEILKPHAMGR